MYAPDTLPVMALHVYLKRIVEQRETLSRDDARTLMEEILHGSIQADNPGNPHSM